MVTLDDIRKYETELRERFKDAPVAIAGVSQGFYSVARHYGGCVISGKHFIYNPADDSLVREDVVKWVVKRKKQEAKETADESVG